MPRMKEHPSLTAPGLSHEALPPLPTHPIDASGSGSTKEVKPAKKERVLDSTKPIFSMEEVRKHSTAESAWIVVDFKVYDCTQFLKAHPGGADSILLSAGTDCTEEFEAIHSKKAWKMLEDYYIGQVEDEELGSGSDEGYNSPNTVVSDVQSNRLVALDPKKKISFALLSKEQLSSDSFKLRFALQSSKHILGLPVGKHMFFYAKIDGKTVLRAYTPTSSDHDVGYFDLVIKVYYPGVHPQFPQGGKMSQYLGAMKIGDSIDVKGPLGHVNYLGSGQLLLHEKEQFTVKTFVMLCAGTGITPMFQVISAILRDPADSVQLIMIYANRTEEDILLRADLDALEQGHQTRLRIQHVLSQPTDATKTAHIKGRVTFDIMQSHIPRGTEEGMFALLCGPQGLIDDIFIPGLKRLGYPPENIISF